MEIFEITKLDEAPPILQKIGQSVKAALGDPNAQAAQRTSKITQQSGVLADAFLKSWLQKTAQLSQAAAVSGKSLSDTEYKKNFEDFVIKNLLSGRDMSTLDPTSKSRITKQINQAITDKGDPDRFKRAVVDLVTVAGAARVDPTKTQAQQQPKGIQSQIVNKRPLQVNVAGTVYQANQDAQGNYTDWQEFQTGKTAPATIANWMKDNLQQLDARDKNLQAIADQIAQNISTTSTGKSPATPGQGAANAEKILNSLLNAQQQSGLSQFLKGSLGDGGTVKSTGNPDVDAFLNKLGVKTQ